MRTAIAQSFIAILFIATLASCDSNSATQEGNSDNSTDTSSTAAMSPIKMEVKKYSDREEGCKTDDCTYIELQIPAIDGGDAAAMKNINTYIDGVYREAVKARLAEPMGNTTIAAMCAAFIEGYKLFLMEFPDSEQKWYLEIDGSKSIVGADYFTVVVNHEEYLGGAHSAAFTQLNSFDLSNGNMIDITEKYGAGKLLTLAEAKFREMNKLDSKADLNDAGFMFKEGKFALPENMGLTKEGVLMVYNSYEVASYAQGETRFTIPYSALNGDL
ncbi:DUF3298 domain-containing protein [Cryomorpha ignava]|uniref:DUF3298 domain-containing protein n=1 Tax=Cryomorpha ignava TaxID=101383 RepID=A0A7K3WU07_9FLAO|nr:RsiV family protein [Cryomorpha ignava]NEN24984.1 DUF3298 domain-containing protein [Cryomorpha ignava]